MTYTCAVCNRPVHREGDYVALRKKEFWEDARPDNEDFLLHAPCARTLTRGLGEPI